MSKNNENKLVPRLRFPEFRNESWKDSELSKLGKTINGLNGKSSEDFGTGKPFVTYKQVFDSAKVDLSKCGRVVIKENENQNTLLKGDILFTTSSETPHEVGYASVVLNEPNEPTYLNSFCFSFRPFSLKQLQPEFSQYLFHSPTYRKSIGVLAQGITRFNISKGAFLKIKVPLPKNPIEQQKIAACLSSLDDVITAESKKLEVLKEHKKGLLQNLFPQEGETVPKLRFKEFEDSGEWKVMTIEQVAKVTTGNKDTQNKVDNGEYPFFVRSQNVERINSYSYDGEAILTSGDGVGVGKNFHYINGKFDFHQRVYCIYEFEKEVSGRFVYMYFSQHFFERVMRMSAKNSVDSVRMAMITEMPILIPSKKEQQKIADTLSSIDNLINAQSQKIETLKLHKKGLLQGLFPDVNEHNG